MISECRQSVASCWRKNQPLVYDVATWITGGLVLPLVFAGMLFSMQSGALADRDAVRHCLYTQQAQEIVELNWYGPIEIDGQRYIRLQYTEEVRPGVRLAKDDVFTLAHNTAFLARPDGALFWKQWEEIQQ